MPSLSIKKGLLRKEIEVPASKSYANRALILASLAPRKIRLSQVPTATDVTFLRDSLESLGISFMAEGDDLIVTNSFPECENGSKALRVGEGGTTARFLAALLLLGRETYTLELGKRLAERPWDEFLDLVHGLGARAELKERTLTLKGPLKLPKVLQIDCSKTTQFATAFELLSSRTNCEVVPLRLSSSQSYWEMTKSLIEEFKTTDRYSVPLDWSGASYPLAFGALNQEIYFPRLRLDSLQADSKFFHVLHSLGCLSVEENGLRVTPLKMTKDFTLDVSDCLDLVPTLGYFLSHLKGTHQLKGVGNLVHKESDRLSEVQKLLNIFGKRTEHREGTLVIYGEEGRISEKRDLVLPDDHRMVMAGALFLLHHGGGSVAPAEAVRKSYPDFFSLLSV
jgi:3-phosphoshikimate 1-carboxyvinyltransferase